MITIDNQEVINIYLDKSRFIAGPTLPGRSNVELSIVYPFSILLGLLVSSIVIFGGRFIKHTRD